MKTQQEELLIPYGGQRLRVTAHSDDADTFFTVYLPGSELELKMEYIDDNPYWTENGVVTERSEELGRLIEESDGR